MQKGKEVTPTEPDTVGSVPVFRSSRIRTTHTMPRPDQVRDTCLQGNGRVPLGRTVSIHIKLEFARLAASSGTSISACNQCGRSDIPQRRQPGRALPVARPSLDQKTYHDISQLHSRHIFDGSKYLPGNTSSHHHAVTECPVGIVTTAP